MSQKWIYIFGERSGADLKIGETGGDTVEARLKKVNSDQTANESYIHLAAVLGSGKDEDAIHRAFKRHLRPKGTKQEYFWPTPEVVEYAAWLRSQWFSSPTGTDSRKDWTSQDPDLWLPDGRGRRIARPEDDPTKMIQDFVTMQGPLAGTPWSWFPDPKASIQDYFTPLYLVDAARVGMGGIDLDAASHWLANRKLRIPRYFTRSHSAFDHDWAGKVWLNPPYGENDKWWARVLHFIESGDVEQISILSPVYAFTTEVARPLMERSSAALLLTPTPKFWGNSEGRTGTNHPHAIVYIGHRTTEVLRAFGPHGIPLRLAYDQMKHDLELAAA